MYRNYNPKRSIQSNLLRHKSMSYFLGRAPMRCLPPNLRKILQKQNSCGNIVVFIVWWWRWQGSRINSGRRCVLGRFYTKLPVMLLEWPDTFTIRIRIVYHRLEQEYRCNPNNLCQEFRLGSAGTALGRRYTFISMDQDCTDYTLLVMIVPHEASRCGGVFWMPRGLIKPIPELSSLAKIGIKAWLNIPYLPSLCAAKKSDFSEEACTIQAEDMGNKTLVYIFFTK
jgi:hypothetical protein